MSVSLSTLQTWLKDGSAVRCVLVEVAVKLSGGSTTTRYLSNTGYVTAGADVPANTVYLPLIAGGVKFTESISLDGAFSLSYGDIELTNANGELDTWLNDYWANRRIRVWVGDKSWIRDDFYPIFDGIVTGIDSRKRGTINLKLSDKLQRLNNPVTETKLGGSTPNADKLLPLCFGECHNVEPLLVDAATHEYMVHNGQIEDIIEVRDNGVPVSVTKFLSTGKFRLLASPSGRITASVQGFVQGVNAARWSEQIANAVWVKALLSVTADATTSPHGGLAEVISSTGAGGTAIYQQTADVAASNTFTFSVYLKAGTHPGNINIHINDQTGAEVAAQNVITPTATWQRYYVTGTFTPAAVGSPRFYINPTSNATGAGQTFYAWGAQVEIGVSFPREYTRTTSAAANIFPRTAWGITRHLTTDYGLAGSRFTSTDIDLTAMHAFEMLNQQPLGLYMSERTNVLDACNRVADSLGARMVMSKTGLLSLVKLTLPQTGPGTVVTATDMVDRSLHVASLPAVKAGVKIGYCKNWTVQDNVALGVIEEHANLFEDEWLTATATDSTAATNFNLFTEPVLEETLLLVPGDASTEATRRLNVFNVQRKCVKYRGYGNLMLEVLGNPQTIQHSRYGLSGGVVGQIISITTDWLNQKADIEVLI